MPATAATTDAKVTELRIQRALAKPRAIGMKGFLLWTEAAWPPAISRKILDAASRYTPGATSAPASVPAATMASPAAQGFGRYGVGHFGDDSGLLSVSFDPSSIDLSSANQAIAAANDPTQAPVSQTTAATPAQPASPSWLSDVGGAITAATTAFLGATQIKDAQTIFNTNLARAQAGLPMIPTNPVNYGLPAPTANIGLAASAQTTLFIVVGVGALALVLASLGGKKR